LVVYLTLEQVRSIHHAIIRAIEGERDSCLHPGIYESLLVGCLDRPQTNIRGYTPYPDIFLKAASLIECIISTNAFIDGSKRTGFLACELFLEINGYFIDPKVQIKSFLLDIAQNNVDLKTIANWLQANALQK
jgi:death-on-curing protein